MPVQLNHIIIPSHDKVASSSFLAGILGVDPPQPVAHFMCVQVDNGVTLDYDDAESFRSQHCAFLVSDEEFDGIFERVKAAGVTHFADPGHRQKGEMNHRGGGRGFYFSDPDGHNMEVFTRVPI